MEELILFSQRYYDIFVLATFLLGVSFLLSKALRKGGKDTISNSGGRIPGRLGLPFIGETFSFISAANSSKGCYDFVKTRRLRYGKWFQTKLFGKVHIFVSSNESARKILTGDFEAGIMKPMADVVGRNSLVCVSPDNHKRIRRLLSDPFSMPSMHSYVNKFDALIFSRLKDLEVRGKSFSVLAFATKITFDGMCNMLLSITEESRLREMERDISAISDAMLSVPLMIPGTTYYKGMKARQRILETVGRIIESRRSGQESEDDFLQSMLERDSYSPSDRLDDKEMMDNILMLLFGGHGTTAAAIMWSVKFLDENKEAQDILRGEQLGIARNKKDESSLYLEDLNSMSYGLKVVKETLRMANIFYWFPKRALKDCTIDGHNIKKGWHVDIDATCIHFDPDLYEDPHRFNPSRFDGIQKPCSFIPFGSGPRMCLGMNMAKVSLLVFLHRLTSGYTWSVDDLDPTLEKKGTIPRLRTGCPITLKAIK